MTLCGGVGGYDQLCCPASPKLLLGLDLGLGCDNFSLGTVLKVIMESLGLSKSRFWDSSSLGLETEKLVSQISVFSLANYLYNYWFEIIVTA